MELQVAPSLRPYQLEDVAKANGQRCFALFNEQRTGKTPTALNIMKNRNCKKILIVCPPSALYQWKEEYETWFGQDCVALTGTPKQKEKLLKEWKSGLVASYGALKQTKKSSGLLKEILEQNPDGIILDESHRIKEPTTATAKMAFKMIGIPNRLALTGTPAPNHLHEIWSILYFLWPEYFPSYWKFVKRYFHTTVQTGNNGQYMDIGTFKSRALELELQLFLEKHSTQRKRKEVMQWLPEKDKQRILLPPTPAQWKYLKDLEKYFETEHIITQGTLDRLVRYRQICLHPALLNLKGESPKMEWVLDYLKDYPEEPTIIFSKFTSFLKILSQELPIPHGLIIGETPLLERNTLKNDFQSGKLKLLLINIDAGKEALTLDTATTTIFTDKYPPVSDLLQAEDRFVATTEDKANKPHRIFELIMKDTYDEVLYSLIDRNATTVDVLNDYNKYLKQKGVK